jgi:LysM repeat protein
MSSANAQNGNEETFIPPASVAQSPAPTSHNTSKAPDQDSSAFLSEGKSNGLTVNTPFTAIPGLPGLSKILARFDKTTQQDLGFTLKGNAEKVPNKQGEQDLQLTLDYVGFGVMSSKFNVQFSPVSIKVESGVSKPEPHWGCSASVLSSPIGLIHERAGVKGTFSDCNSTRTFSAAPEFSYQSSNKFKTLSTATGGYFFGDKATLRISAEYVPTLERIKAASPDMEEWKMIADHIAPSIPAIQIGRAIDQGIEIAGNAINSAIGTPTQTDTQSSKLSTQSGAISAEDKGTKSAFNHRVMPDSKLAETSTTIKIAQENDIRQQASTSDTKPSNAVKSTYPVQQNDTLGKIGKKTGHPWTELYKLNQELLKNNPDKIYPGQEQLIPDPHHHASLINHPVVQAQILANLAAHYAKQDQYSL